MSGTEGEADEIAMEDIFPAGRACCFDNHRGWPDGRKGPAPGDAIDSIISPADLATKVPSPKTDDVKSIDAIMHAAYDSISGPAGPRNWDRFRSLFLPQARFTQVGRAPDGSTFIISWSEEEFIRDAGAIFSKNPFYENAIVNKPESFGGMTQVLSSYESHRSVGDKPFERGVNSFQLLNDGKRWWIVSIFWDSERPDNPLPAKLAKK
jgi:hypothetical protein